MRCVACGAVQVLVQRATRPVASHDKVKHPTANPPRPLSAKLASCERPAQQPGLGHGDATPKLYEDTNIVSQGCHDVFRELDTSVKAYEAKSTKGKMRILSRTKWLFDSGRLTELGQVLRRYNDVLHLMVSVMTIVEGRRAAYVSLH